MKNLVLAHVPLTNDLNWLEKEGITLPVTHAFGRPAQCSETCEALPLIRARLCTTTAECKFVAHKPRWPVKMRKTA